MTMIKSAALAATTLALAACQGSAPAEPMAAPEAASPATAAGGVVVGVRGGATVLRPGQTLSIALPSNGSTGYAWRVGAFDEAVLKRATPFGEEVTNARPAGMVGVPGETQWRFDAGSPGTTTLEFAYGRPWETGVAPAETARFTVTVG